MSSSFPISSPVFTIYEDSSDDESSNPEQNHTSEVHGVSYEVLDGSYQSEDDVCQRLSPSLVKKAMASLEAAKQRREELEQVAREQDALYGKRGQAKRVEPRYNSTVISYGPGRSRIKVKNAVAQLPVPRRPRGNITKPLPQKENKMDDHPTAGLRACIENGYLLLKPLGVDGKVYKSKEAQRAPAPANDVLWHPNGTHLLVATGSCRGSMGQGKYDNALLVYRVANESLTLIASSANGPHPIQKLHQEGSRLYTEDAAGVVRIYVKFFLPNEPHSVPTYELRYMR